MVSGLPQPARRQVRRARAPAGRFASERQARADRLARPGRLLRVDDHVVPCGADWELINGRRVKVMPADIPHSQENVALTALLVAFRAPGYGVGLDLLLRSDEKNDFASDNCLFPEGEDPERGGRRLDELVFEISTTKSNMRRDTTKARVLSGRGVRRIFCVLLKGGPVVFEWDHARQDWTRLADDAFIEDQALAEPLPVRLLLDLSGVPDAVAARAVARDAAPVREARERSRAEGRAEGVLLGQRQMLLAALRLRFDTLNATTVDRVEAADEDALRRWMARLLAGQALDDLLQR